MQISGRESCICVASCRLRDVARPACTFLKVRSRVRDESWRNESERASTRSCTSSQRACSERPAMFSTASLNAAWIAARRAATCLSKSVSRSLEDSSAPHASYVSCLRRMERASFHVCVASLACRVSSSWKSSSACSFLDLRRVSLRCSPARGSLLSRSRAGESPRRLLRSSGDLRRSRSLSLPLSLSLWLSRSRSRSPSRSPRGASWSRPRRFRSSRRFSAMSWYRSGAAVERPFTCSLKMPSLASHKRSLGPPLAWPASTSDRHRLKVESTLSEVSFPRPARKSARCSPWCSRAWLLRGSTNKCTSCTSFLSVLSSTVTRSSSPNSSQNVSTVEC
mmetsp:Transcript_60839/g.144827  ORF Transcript_60839/g.144827 Transcript_60839/m.144827 type:complete len:337 (+) Transcript_60839:439-1449(+)